MPCEIKKIYLVYFSPSGSTEKIVKTLASGIKGLEIENIDLLTSRSRKKKYIFSENDLVIFGSMTAGKLFTLSDEIFSCLEGHGTPFIGLVTYGNSYYGIALNELQDRATKSGFKVTALGAFIARHAIDFSVGEGRPDAQDNEKIIDFGQRAYQKILAGDLELHEQPKTNFSASEQANKLIAYREEHPDEAYALPPSYKSKEISEACIKCGTCAKHCPVNAINIQQKSFDLDKCIGCWACINRCPVHAIKSTSLEMADIMNTFSKTFAPRLEPDMFL